MPTPAPDFPTTPAGFQVAEHDLALALTCPVRAAHRVLAAAGYYDREGGDVARKRREEVAEPDPEAGRDIEPPPSGGSPRRAVRRVMEEAAMGAAIEAAAEVRSRLGEDADLDDYLARTTADRYERAAEQASIVYSGTWVGHRPPDAKRMAAMIAGAIIRKVGVGPLGFYSLSLGLTNDYDGALRGGEPLVALNVRASSRVLAGSSAAPAPLIAIDSEGAPSLPPVPLTWLSVGLRLAAIPSNAPDRLHAFKRPSLALHFSGGEAIAFKINPYIAINLVARAVRDLHDAMGEFLNPPVMEPELLPALAFPGRHCGSCVAVGCPAIPTKTEDSTDD